MLPIRFIVAVLLFVALAAVGRRPLREALGSTLDGIRAWWREAGPIHLLGLAAIVVAGVILRWHYIDVAMRWDESYTTLKFGVPRLSIGVSTADIANHPLNSLLIHFAYVLFGAGHRSVRSGVFAAGCLVTPTAYIAGTRLYGRHAGILAAALVAGSAQAVEFSTNARGYALTMLWAVAVLAVAPSVVRSTNPTYWAQYALFGALGVYSQVVYLYALLPIGAATLIAGLTSDYQPRRAFLVRFAGMAAAMLGYVALLYGPTFTYFVNAVLHGSFANDPGAVGRELWRVWTLGMPLVVKVVLVAAFLAAAGALWTRRTRSFPLESVLAVAAAIVVLAGRVAPFTRYFSALVPLVLLGAAGGLAGWESVQRALSRRAAAIAVSIVAVGWTFWSVHVVSRNGTANQGSSPLPAAEQIASLVGPRLSSNDRLVVSSAAWPVEAYTFFSRGWGSWQLVVGTQQPEWARHGKTYVVVDTLRDETLRSVLAKTAQGTGLHPPGTLLAEFPGADVYEFGPVTS